MSEPTPEKLKLPQNIFWRRFATSMKWSGRTYLLAFAYPDKTAVYPLNENMTLFFLLLLLLFRSACHQVLNQADKFDLLAIFYY